MFAANKPEGTDTNKTNPMQTSLFAKKPEVSPPVNAAQPQKEEKPSLTSGLFSTQQPSLFPSAPQTQNQTEKTEEVKTPMWGNLSSSSGQSLFSNSAAVSDKKNEPKAG